MNKKRPVSRCRQLKAARKVFQETVLKNFFWPMHTFQNVEIAHLILVLLDK